MSSAPSALRLYEYTNYDLYNFTQNTLNHRNAFDTQFFAYVLNPQKQQLAVASADSKL
jgi:hypothetical protein